VMKIKLAEIQAEIFCTPVSMVGKTVSKPLSRSGQRWVARFGGHGGSDRHIRSARCDRLP
jgi:hypothetical protein